jgi:hypothetical protein
MSYSELSEKNFRRICVINWSLTLPVMLLFAWPFYLLAVWTGVSAEIAFSSSFLFALPFMMTVLHGHVTMALGALHRHHYYEWLARYPFSLGFLFHPVMFRTRFRLAIAILAGSILVFSWALNW